MSPEQLIMLESGARLGSAVVLGVFIVVGVKLWLTSLGQMTTEERMARLRLEQMITELDWRVDQLAIRQRTRLTDMERRLAFTEAIVHGPGSGREIGGTSN